MHPRRIKTGQCTATDLGAVYATIFKSIGRKLTENTQEQKKVRSISQTNSRTHLNQGKGHWRSHEFMHPIVCRHAHLPCSPTR